MSTLPACATTTFAPTSAAKRIVRRRVVDGALAQRGSVLARLNSSGWPRGAPTGTGQKLCRLSTRTAFCADHLQDAGHQVQAQVVAQFHAVESEAQDLLDHPLAARVAAGVPAR